MVRMGGEIDRPALANATRVGAAKAATQSDNAVAAVAAFAAHSWSWKLRRYRHINRQFRERFFNREQRLIHRFA